MRSEKVFSEVPDHPTSFQDTFDLIVGRTVAIVLLPNQAFPNDSGRGASISACSTQGIILSGLRSLFLRGTIAPFNLIIRSVNPRFSRLVYM